MRNISLKSGKVVTIMICDKSHDDLVGGGKASLTLGMTELLNDTSRLNDTSTNAGGWEATQFRLGTGTGTTLSLANLIADFPDDWQATMKTVNKLTANGGSQSGTAVITTADKMWLFSEIEIFRATTYSRAGEGTQYAVYAALTQNAQRIKALNNGVGSAQYWWLRSPYSSNTYYFCSVDTAGAPNYVIAYSSNGVCLGFCI